MLFLFILGHCQATHDRYLLLGRLGAAVDGQRDIIELAVIVDILV